MTVVQSANPNTPQFLLPVVGSEIDGKGIESTKKGYDGQPIGTTIGAIGIQQYTEHTQSHHSEVKDMAYIELAGAVIGLALLVVTLVNKFK